MQSNERTHVPIDTTISRVSLCIWLMWKRKRKIQLEYRTYLWMTCNKSFVCTIHTNAIDRIESIGIEKMFAFAFAFVKAQSSVSQCNFIWFAFVCTRIVNNLLSDRSEASVVFGVKISLFLYFCDDGKVPLKEFDSMTQFLVSIFNRK